MKFNQVVKIKKDEETLRLGISGMLGFYSSGGPEFETVHCGVTIFELDEMYFLHVDQFIPLDFVAEPLFDKDVREEITVIVDPETGEGRLKD